MAGFNLHQPFNKRLKSFQTSQIEQLVQEISQTEQQNEIKLSGNSKNTSSLLQDKKSSVSNRQ